ncbi:MAG: hypothetical protein K6G81_03685 [Lachnospiraceae bacterium]|nr:hypothetical protein [Lachnospiraceae bacterium]
MKGLKKLFAIMLAFAMVAGIMGVTPAEAKAKQQLGVPFQLNGSCWLDELIYGGYTEEGFVPETDAEYSMSYEMYVPLRAFNEWNIGSTFENGGWTDADNPCGKLSIRPFICWYSDVAHAEYRMNDFNNWDVNHYFKDGDEFIIDGLWTEETGSLFVEDVEGPGVMTAKIVDDMVKVTVKDLKALGCEITYASDETGWEPTPFEGSFDGSEDMMFGLFFGEWIGGDQVETLYVTSASVKMNGKTIWKASVNTEWNAGNVTYDLGKTDEEGSELFDCCEVKAVPFNTSAVKLSKSKVEVKAKKSASVKVTTMNIADVPGEGFGEEDRFPVTVKVADKVSVKSTDKKIATAKLKNGKIKITGKKKGTAKILVTVSDVTKEIAVTVK